MKKVRTAICLAVIAACIPGILISAMHLPADAKPLIAEKYAGWSGVLRIWAFEGWTGGDKMAAWVGRCAAAFEKSHPGVYVEVSYPGEEAIRSLSRSGVRPPDLIAFPPGLMDSPDGLAPLPELPVRNGLGGEFAAAVALGGYAWAVNNEADGTAVPADEDWRSWSQAAAALGDPGAIIEEIELEPPGIDLGLPASSRTPLERFTAGELGAAAITQRELARLQRLRDQGRGPDWTLRPGAQPWTDQVIYMAAVESGGEQQALAMELIAYLLSPECQSALVKCDLFSVLDAPTGYAPGSAMEAMELALLRKGLTAPPAFNAKCEP